MIVFIIYEKMVKKTPRECDDIFFLCTYYKSERKPDYLCSTNTITKKLIDTEWTQRHLRRSKIYDQQYCSSGTGNKFGLGNLNLFDLFIFSYVYIYKKTTGAI